MKIIESFVVEVLEIDLKARGKDFKRKRGGSKKVLSLAWDF